MLSHWNSGMCVYTVCNISNTQTAKTCSGRVWCLWRGMNEILCSQVLSLVALLYFLPNPLKGAVAKHNPVTVGKWTHGPAKCYVYNTQLQVTLMPDWKGQIFCLRRGDAVPRLHTRSSVNQEEDIWAQSWWLGLGYLLTRLKSRTWQVYICRNHTATERSQTWNCRHIQLI